MKRHTVRILALASGLALPVGPGAGAGITTQPASRPAPPDAAAQKKSLRQIEEVYGKEFAAAKAPDKQAAFAERLLQLADETSGDPAGRYVLLAKALEMATAAGEFHPALAAIGEIEGRWDVDVLKLEADVLTTCGKGIRGARQAADIDPTIKSVTKDAILVGKFDVARRLNDAALAAARGGEDSAQIKEVTARARDLVDMQEGGAKAQPALVLLKDRPDDAPASLAAGKYLCFTIGNWADGLPRLSAGSDAALSALAKKEAGLTADPAAQSAVADEWWNYADSQGGLARRQIRLHAAAWYREAEPGLTGLTHAKATARANESQSQDAAGGLVGGMGATVVRRKSVELAAAPGRVRLVNTAGVKEGQDVIDGIAVRYPELLKAATKVELVKVHDAAEFRRNAGGPRDLAGAFSPTPVAGKSNGLMLWGIYEEWPAGKYLVAYRLQSLDKPAGDDVCFCDVCKNGNTIASRHPKAPELTPAGWHEVAFPLDLGSAATVEFRLWPNNHEIAVDRVYLFRLPG